MKNYQFLVHGTQYGHGSMKGEVVELSNERAKPLLEANAVKEVSKEQASDLPEDLPGRDYLVDFTLEDVREMDAEMLQDVKGIGKATAKAIVNYFESEA